MREIIISCKTLQREIELVLEMSGKKFEIIWIESGLHNTPSRLTLRLQEELDKVSEKYGRVLLCFGTCGNSVLGLKIRNFELIIPRVDDCISLLLGSLDKRIEISNEKVTYFLTKGWIEGERNIWFEYQYSLEKYGEEITEEIFKTMLNGYTRLGILDTGAYNIEEVMKESEIIAETFKLKIEKLDASVDYINKLFFGPWEKDKFIIIPPNSEILIKDVGLKSL